MSELNHEKIVLNHLKNNGYITSMLAFDLYGITRLSSVIHRLRKQGYDIETKTRTSKNRYGHIVNYGIYYLR